MKKKCTECDREARRGSLCPGHKSKLQRTGVRGGTLPRAGLDKLGRYLLRVDRRGADECWPWTGSRNEHNYGRVADDDGHWVRAHRFGFTKLIRPLEPGEVVDHTCHNSDESCPGGDTCEHRACQNPAHWEATDDETNGARGKSFSAVNARKTHCKWGHEFTEDNTYRRPNGGRQCKTCTILAALGKHPRQLARQEEQAI
jgi:hypothetical protein